MGAGMRSLLAVGVLMGCSCLGVGADESRIAEKRQTGAGVAAQEKAASKVAAGDATKVTAAVVFRGGTGFIDAVKQTCQDFSGEKLQDCFAREMKKAKASAEAAEFSRQLGEPGFARDYKAAGTVDIVYVLYPYRANENQSWLVVNGEPAIIDVDNQKLLAAEAVKSDATYLALGKRHADVSLWPGDRGGTEYPDVEKGENGEIRIVVNYRLREKCHACAVWGHAWYAFDYDAQGKFAGAKLAAVSIAREKAMVARDAKKTVVLPVGEEVTMALPVKPGAGEEEWKLAGSLDTAKIRLIEHSHVAPPAAGGAVGSEELWNFAGLGIGTTRIAVQRKDDARKVVAFRVVVRGRK